MLSSGLSDNCFGRPPLIPVLSNTHCSKDAADIKDTAEMVKVALEEAERAQNAASKAIEQAATDIRGTQDLLVSVSRQGRTAVSWVYAFL